MTGGCKMVASFEPGGGLESVVIKIGGERDASVIGWMAAI